MAGKSFIAVSLLVWLNVFLSVLIVVLNKWIYIHHGIPSVTLTCLHFVVTTFCVFVCERIGVFHRKSLPIMDVLPLSLTFCAFVVFINISLQTNSVGTYLVFKMAMIPAVVALDAFWCCCKLSNDVLLTLIPIVLGIFLNACSDVTVTLLGTVFAILAVLSTSLYQVVVRLKYRALQVNSLQLLLYQAPLSVIFLMPIIPVIEPIFSEHGLFAVWSYESLGIVLLSGFVAFGINFSMFHLTGSLSPLIYNAIGHMKFCLTLLASLVVFRERLNQMQIFATALAFIGCEHFFIPNGFHL